MKYSRPTVKIEVFEIFKKDKEMMWNLFKKHHYLSEKLNKAARCFIAKWNDKIIGFNSVLPLPHGSLKDVWREHRLVVLSDFQGLGVGTCLSECIAKLIISEGKRYYSRTANKKLGDYRNNSNKWKPTSSNGKPARKNLEKVGKNVKYNLKLVQRICFSHEYIGN